MDLNPTIVSSSKETAKLSLAERRSTTRSVASRTGFFVVGGLAVALLSAPAFAQTSAPAQAVPTQSTPGQDAAAPPSAAADAPATYATGKPLAEQSHEGFWGHLNPFARKKWVHRQVDPIADRANELDELQAKNANDIRDVDGRATAGVNRAMTSAQAADAHAADAAGRADRANSLAVSADGKTTQLHGTVSNLDQYKQVSSTSLNWVAGRTALSAKDKASLQAIAASLSTEKGYIVEVEGFSRRGVASSQAMADSVVRYLVTAQNVPLYRIYRTGLGKQAVSGETDTKPFNGVRVTVLHNSLAEMGSGATASTPTGVQ